MKINESRRLKMWKRASLGARARAGAGACAYIYLYTEYFIANVSLNTMKLFY